MLMIVVKDIDAYSKLSKHEFKTRLTCLCGGDDFVFWGTYTRKLLPDNTPLVVQRVRCKTCLCTHGVLPSFILGRIRYSADTIGSYFEKWLTSACSLSRLWNDTAADGPEDISTLYVWGRRFRWALSEICERFTGQAYSSLPGY